jgi:hypothetical protein
MTGIEVTLIGIGVGLGVNIVVAAAGYGRVSQKVDSLNKQINNGWTCKQHSSITQELGNLQGSRTYWDGKERRHYKS